MTIPLGPGARRGSNWWPAVSSWGGVGRCTLPAPAPAIKTGQGTGPKQLQVISAALFLLVNMSLTKATVPVILLVIHGRPDHHDRIH